MKSSYFFGWSEIYHHCTLTTKPISFYLICETTLTRDIKSDEWSFNRHLLGSYFAMIKTSKNLKKTISNSLSSTLKTTTKLLTYTEGISDTLNVGKYRGKFIIIFYCFICAKEYFLIVAFKIKSKRIGFKIQ